MASGIPKYVSPENRNKVEGDIVQPKPTAWGIQQHVVEVIRNYFMTTDSREYGYPWKYDYVYPSAESPQIKDFEPTGEDGVIINDLTQSTIVISSAFEHDLAQASKRPLIVVYRGLEQSKFETLGHGMLNNNPEESFKVKTFGCVLPITVKICAKKVGLAEGVAEFVRNYLLCMAEQIAREACLSSFKLVSMSPPALNKTSSDFYEIDLDIDVKYQSALGIFGDDLKIQQISIAVLNPSKPNTLLKNQ